MRLQLLSGKDIEQALPMSEAIEVNAEAYRLLSLGQATMPQRLRMDTHEGTMLFMPAFVRPTGALAVKVVSIFGGNVRKGLPTIQALVLVIDSDTGEPMAIMDGESLTALRTGAGAGAATGVLARDDARIMGLLGAGAQAWAQVRAVLAVRRIEEIRIYTPSGSSARRLADRLSQEHPELRVLTPSKPEQAVADADIVTCVTNSPTPVFDPASISPGCHINGVGSFTAEMREVRVNGLPGRRIFVDSREAALTEAGDLIQAIAEGDLRPDDLTDIGQVVSGAAPGRISADDVTFFKSVGVAVQDAATAQAVMNKAAEMGLGKSVEL